VSGSASMSPAPRDHGDLDNDAFRRAAHRVAEWSADYLRDVELHRVLPDVHPGDVRGAFPDAAPEEGETVDAMLADIDRVIVPASTQWQAPGFMAYFASSAAAAGILGETIAATLNANAMLWRTAPASTELEEVTLDWLRRLVGLPEPLFGVINDTASS